MLSVRFRHREYGCESGCCGHDVEVYDENGEFLYDDFTFSHVYDSLGGFDKFKEKIIYDLLYRFNRPDFTETDLQQALWDFSGVSED